MAAQTLPLTVEEFHKLYDGEKPAYEYWYGAAVRKPVPTLLHGIVQSILIMLLGKAGWRPASEVRLKVIPEAEPIPDVIAVRGKFKGRYPTVAPELCIEIMSPSDAFSRTLEKANRYILWGTRWVWIIDPQTRTAWTVSRERASGPECISTEGSLRAGETMIALPTLFAEVDDALELSEPAE